MCVKVRTAFICMPEFKYKHRVKLDLVVHVFSPSTREAHTHRSRSEASLFYRESSRIARDT